MNIKLFGFWGLAISLVLALAIPALAVQVPHAELMPDPEKDLGEPVAYIQVAPDKEKESAYHDLKKQKQYILGYREISLLNLNTESPVLVTWTFNQGKSQITKTYFNWAEIDSIQILNPKIKLPE